MGAYLEVLSKVVARLQDLPTLSYLGFHTDFEGLGKKAKAEEPRFYLEETLAGKCLELSLALVGRRLGSMAWHDQSWPGILSIGSGLSPNHWHAPLLASVCNVLAVGTSHA